MDEAIGRMPDTPHAHLPLTRWTAQGVSPGALLRALAVGERGDDLNRSLDDALDVGQGFLNPAFDLCKRLGRLHPVIADPLEAFGKRMLHQAADKRVDVDPFPFHPLALVRTVVIGDAVAIIAVDTPQRDRRTHDICGQIPRQTLIPCRHIAFLHVGDKPLTLACVTHIDELLDLGGLHRLAQHRQQMPLPLLPQHAIGHVVQMHPLLGLLIPSTTGGNDV
jgi:hypothetical protein